MERFFVAERANLQGSRGRSGLHLLRTHHAARWGAKRYREVRDALGLSRREAAELAGIAEATYRNVERGTKILSHEVYQRYRLRLFERFGPIDL